MLRLAHLTDIHLGPLPAIRTRELMSKRVMGWVSWQRFRRQRHRLEVLDALIEDLHAQSCDHVALTGDLVNISLPGEFEQAARWLERLGPPERVTVIPGNHDAYVPGVSGKGWLHWRDYMQRDGGAPFPAFPYARRVGRTLVLALSSAVPTPPGWAAGKLGHEQIVAARGILEQAGRDGLFRVVMLHHPPVYGWSHRRKALIDAPDFRRAIAETGAELVLCGHEHVFNFGTLDGAQGPAAVVGAPSASLWSEEVEKSGGYVIYGIRPEDGVVGMELEVRRFDAMTGAFCSTRRGRIAEDGAGLALQPWS
ncbi:metallophosphoesterase family protein [Marinimicrococcus flavescens]|uniref:Metallophosphoesterase n=1 Tax=Marinimicrococcus flavescens TaxID=3031815 RepID=A0AAP3V2S1_9PROT|nr:metallophosphoesterase [Marinimicrococcus flavescens]